MAITGIDAVVYGVSDMARSRRYFSDWGLKKTKSGSAESILITANGAEVVLRSAAAKGLPSGIESGATLREIVWRVTAKKDLRDIEKELSKDRAVTIDRAGTLHSSDDLGLGIAFRVARRTAIKPVDPPMNSPISINRIDKRATYYDRARPLTIGHCVFMAPDIERMERFYTLRLGFHVSDYYTGRGVFLRCSARGAHHNLFFLESADGKAALNHVAFGVRDIHELFAGGAHIQSRGWKTQIGPGRHHISSCYFWYFYCPAGGATEYFCDEDFLTEKWQPGHWNPAPETFAEWVLANGLTRSKALPPTREKRDAG
jgi:catechol 2,3-dioxygenase-like lactoylglutathione lyase family enzyme